MGVSAGRATVVSVIRRQDEFDRRLLERLRRLRDPEQLLPRRLHIEITACGEAALEPLLEMIEGEEWSACHAAALIGEIGPAPVVGALIGRLSEVEPMDPLRDALVFALARGGPALVEPALRAHAASDDEEFRLCLAGALSRAKVRDERVLRILLDMLEQQEDLGPAFLAEYGDPRALPALQHALDHYTVRPSGHFLAYQYAFDLADAIQELGGELGESAERKLRRAVRMREEAVAPFRQRPAPAPEPVPAASDQTRLGRNDPCWCGSGKKYKRCHLRTDEAAHVRG